MAVQAEKQNILRSYSKYRKRASRQMQLATDHSEQHPGGRLTPWM
jgi:hypothetical protein